MKTNPYNYSTLLIISLIIFIGAPSKLAAQNQAGITQKYLHKNWQFHQADKSKKKYPATVPGTVHTDLINQELIKDPFYGNNETEVQWVENKDWVYELNFNAEEVILHKKNITLNFAGLDTYADVYLNDKKILVANNMFRTWQVDIKTLLKKENNQLKIYFHSPINYAIPFYEKLNYKLPAGNDNADKKVSIFTRKAPYHYGWDWGPRMVTSGIWRPIFIEAWNNGTIENVQIVQKEINNASALIEINTELEINEKNTFNFIYSLNGKEIKTEAIIISPSNPTHQITHTITNPKLWWTHELGEPYRYNLTVEIQNKKGETLAIKSQQIGLRTIELIQEKDKIGTSYYFKLNGEPIFMKGANYIPASNFIPSVTPQKYQQLIQSAKDANMNMLRVWGGGIYENDIFYDLCDQHGIMVWQDFMFACSMYPGDTAFVNNVKQEVIENVKRLRHHPSIALWCGNNEMDVAWHNWGWQKQFNYSKDDSATIWNNYLNIFEKLIPNTVQQLDKRAYVPTSPLSNWGKTENFNHNSMHYWGVWHGEDKFTEFYNNVGRFVSEYGFQSFPDLNNVNTFTPKKEQHLKSDILTKRQKSYKGNRLIFDHLNRHYQEPKTFPHFLYVNQLLQAKGIGMAIDAHRLNKPHCMGTLYWQLNDCWPAISWSSTDYYGTWKALHYTVQQKYQSIYPIVQEQNKQLNIHIVSDILADKNATLKIQLIDFKKGVIKEEEKTINIEANKSKSYFTSDLKKWCKRKKRNQQLIRVAIAIDKEPEIENLHYLIPEKNLTLVTPKISVNTQKIDSTNYRITLKNNNYLAKNVYLSVADESIHFSNNFFDLLPNQTITLTAKTQNEINDLKSQLQIISLVDTF